MEDALTFDGNEACLISCVRGERKPWASFTHRAYNLGTWPMLVNDAR